MAGMQTDAVHAITQLNMRILNKNIAFACIL
jgi:hypothetical protein